MNSIQEVSKIDDIIDEILLTLSHPVGENKIWILIEGVDDGKLYSKFFYENKVCMRPMEGYNYKLLEVISKIKGITNQVVAIKDADFDRLEGKELSYPDTIFLTDCHDAETMMIACNDVLRNIFSEYQIEKEIGEARKEVLKQGTFLGYVRWFNFQRNLEILFDGLGIGKFYNGKDNFDRKECIEVLNIRSEHKKQKLTLEEINNFINSNTEQIDLLELCNGHDLCSIFSIWCTSHSTTKGCNKKDFERSLRLSYQGKHFKTSQLYKSILTWSDDKGYTILLPI